MNLRKISLCLVVLLIGSTGLYAQATNEATIAKVDAALITAPILSYSGAPAKNLPSKKWLEAEVTFNWQPAQPKTQADLYSDDLTVNYYILLNNKSQQYPQGQLVTGQSALSGVPSKSLDPRNGELRSVVYLSPRVMERLFGGKSPTDINSAVVDIGVTISKQGEVIAMKSFKSSQGAWWTQLQPSTGYVLNKSETPFAPLNWDYYEQTKKQP